MKTPYTVGITGGSGSGKTFFLKGISSRFTPAELCLISQDHYYRPREDQPLDGNKVKNFDLPTSIDRIKLHADLRTLKSGVDVVKKEYTFNNPSTEPGMLTFRAAPIIVVEGLFVQYFEEIDAELDLKVFIEAKDHVKFGRRIQRDRVDRGYDLEDVLYRYEHHVMPVYESLIEPLKHKADIVIPNDHGFDKAMDVLSVYLRSLL
ncbi:MAG: uridine kinase [Cytophagales bacterium]|nr:uridine kinase [Cytophagales bacterium]